MAPFPACSGGERLSFAVLSFPLLSPSGAAMLPGHPGQGGRRHGRQQDFLRRWPRVPQECHRAAGRGQVSPRGLRRRPRGGGGGSLLMRRFVIAASPGRETFGLIIIFFFYPPVLPHCVPVTDLYRGRALGAPARRPAPVLAPESIFCVLDGSGKGGGEGAGSARRKTVPENWLRSGFRGAWWSPAAFRFICGFLCFPERRTWCWRPGSWP